MIRLIDLLALQGFRLQNYKKYKIHLATRSTTSPLDAYLEGSFKEWQEEQTKKNFECPMVLSLIQLNGDLWLFAGVYSVINVEQGKNTAFKYSTEILPGKTT